MSTTFLSGLKLVKVFLRQRFAHFYTWYTDGHREHYNYYDQYLECPRAETTYGKRC